MIMQDQGHIVTIASLAGLSGCNRLVDYCASKFAAGGFDESLRTELAVSKIFLFLQILCLRRDIKFPFIN
jgi:short-subunit dehydrogenase